MGHISQKFRLVLRGKRKLLSLLFECLFSLFDFTVFALDLAVLLGQQAGFFFKRFVRGLQFFLLVPEQIFRGLQRTCLLFEPTICLSKLVLLDLQFFCQ